MTTPLAPVGAAYRSALGSLVHGDGSELLGGLATGSVDLVVADPPYGAGKERWDRFTSREAYLDWCEGWLAECHRVLAADGSCFVCGWSETLAYLKVAADRRFAGCRWLVWHYRNKQAARDGEWGRAHESILHLRKGERFRFDQDAVRVPYNGHTERYPDHPQATSSVFGAGNGGATGHRWRPHPLGAKPKDVLDIPTLTNGQAERTTHPTQKPEELIRRLVMACSSPGDLVVDPFAGSGTTLVVCEKLERRWLGAELDAAYVAQAIERLERVEPDAAGHAEGYRQRIARSLRKRAAVRD